MPGLQVIGTRKASVSDDAVVIQHNDRSFALTQTQIAGKTAAQIEAAIAAADLGLPTFYVHVNRDGSVAIHVGETEPTVWPEDYDW